MYMRNLCFESIIYWSLELSCYKVYHRILYLAIIMSECIMDTLHYKYKLILVMCIEYAMPHCSLCNIIKCFAFA